jgi:hypothetical protein
MTAMRQLLTTAMRHLLTVALLALAPALVACGGDAGGDDAKPLPSRMSLRATQVSREGEAAAPCDAGDGWQLTVRYTGSGAPTVQSPRAVQSVCDDPMLVDGAWKFACNDGMNGDKPQLHYEVAIRGDRTGGSVEQVGYLFGGMQVCTASFTLAVTSVEE